MHKTGQDRDSGLLTTAEAARKLGVSTATVNRRVRLGDLTPALQFPGIRGARLYAPADIDALANKEGRR